MDNLHSPQLYSSVSLTVNDSARKALRSFSRLAGVLAILGFGSALLNLVAVIVTYARLHGVDSYFVGGAIYLRLIPLIISMVVAVLLNLFLFTAGISIRKAIDGQHQTEFNRGMRLLSRYYSIYGILLLVGMILVAIVFLAFLLLEST